MRYLWLLLLLVLLPVSYFILYLFRPLSVRLQKEIPVRANQARRLIEGGLTMTDLTLILAFLKHEVERVRHTLTSLTVATGAPVVLGLMPKLFTSAPSRAFDVVLICSVVSFAIVQLYYFAQIRILHLAQTNCLIAQSELQKTA
jgi:hypothetical protein